MIWSSNFNWSQNIFSDVNWQPTECWNRSSDVNQVFLYYLNVYRNPIVFFPECRVLHMTHVGKCFEIKNDLNCVLFISWRAHIQLSSLHHIIGSSTSFPAKEIKWCWHYTFRMAWPNYKYTHWSDIFNFSIRVCLRTLTHSGIYLKESSTQCVWFSLPLAQV